MTHLSYIVITFLHLHLHQPPIQTITPSSSILRSLCILLEIRLRQALAIRLQFVSSREQLADIFTKGLCYPQHNYLCSSLMIGSPNQPEEGYQGSTVTQSTRTAYDADNPNQSNQLVNQSDKLVSQLVFLNCFYLLFPAVLVSHVCHIDLLVQLVSSQPIYWSICNKLARFIQCKLYCSSSSFSLCVLVLNTWLGLLVPVQHNQSYESQTLIQENLPLVLGVILVETPLHVNLFYVRQVLTHHQEAYLVTHKLSTYVLSAAARLK